MSDRWGRCALDGRALRHTLLNNASFIKDLLRVREDSEADRLFEVDLIDRLRLCLNSIVEDMRILESEYRTKYPDAPLYLYVSEREGRNVVVWWRLSKRSASASNELASRLSKSWFKKYLTAFDSVFVAQVERYDLQRLRLNMLYSSLNHQFRLVEKFKE